jgi:hypothetical protein
MANIKSIKTDIAIVVPGALKETSKKGTIEIVENDVEVVIKFPLGKEAQRDLINVLINAPDGVKAHLVEFVEGADI